MTKEEFIQEANKSPLFKKAGILVDSKTLERANLQPYASEEYRVDMLIPLFKSIIGEQIEKQKILSKHGIIELDTIFKDSATLNKEIQSILFLILKPEVQEAIKKFRQDWKIPENGFASQREMDNFINGWVEEVGDFLKNDKEIDKNVKEISLSIKKVSVTKTKNGKKFKAKPKLIDRKYLIKQYAHTSIYGKIAEIMRSFRAIRYSSLAEELLRYYFFLSNPLSSDIFKKYLKEPKWNKISFYNQNLVGLTRNSDSFELHLLIHGNTTAKEVKKVVDGHWHEVRLWQKQLNRFEKPIKNVRKINDIYRDYLVFSLYQNNLKDEEIAGKMLSDYNYKVNSTLVRKIIERVKKRIKKA